jgi:hypothetical protein
MAKHQWRAQAAVVCGWRAVVCDGRKPPQPGFTKPATLYIINYDILPYWVPYFKEYVKPQTVCLDECQNIQNDKTKRKVSRKS